HRGAVVDEEQHVDLARGLLLPARGGDVLAVDRGRLRDGPQARAAAAGEERQKEQAPAARGRSHQAHVSKKGGEKDSRGATGGARRAGQPGVRRNKSEGFSVKMGCLHYGDGHVEATALAP